MRKLNDKYTKWFDAGAWFCILAILGVLTTLISLLQSHGEVFNQIFFGDVVDTGMDFFHSIEYTRGRSPYEEFGTLYPPLANLCFYFLFCMVPEWEYSMWADTFVDGILYRTTSADLRVYQPTMMLFVCFLIITAVVLVIMIQKCFSNMQHTKRSIIAFSALLTYGVLFAYERGNIILIPMLCTLFFLLYYDSENKVINELALLALAIAAGLKLYPALFGVVLIYNKQYKKAIRTVIYGVAFFVLPIFVFKEGLRGFEVFFRTLIGHTTDAKFTTNGYSFDKLVNFGVLVLGKIFGFEADKEWLLAAIPKWNIVACGCALLCGFTMKKRWQQALVCCLAMFLYRDQGIYGTVFFLIPLMLLIEEEKILTFTNIAPFLALVFFVILLPIVDSPYVPFSYQSLRYQCCHGILICYLLVQTGINLRTMIKNKQGKRG